jgi:hypothetical protein
MAKTDQNIKNIIVGAAAVYVTKKDSTSIGWDQAVTPVVDAKDATAFAGTDAYKAMDSLTGPTGEWNDVGYTSEGVEVAYAPEYGEVAVDQLLDSAKIFKQGMKVTVNTTFAEATLENLLVVWGQTEGTLNKATRELEIVPGELGDEPTERGLVFVGPAPRNNSAQKRYDRVYNVTRAIQTESSSHALRRSEMTGLPVSFRLLPDAGAAKSRYGTVVDRARTA